MEELGVGENVEGGDGRKQSGIGMECKDGGQSRKWKRIRQYNLKGLKKPLREGVKL